MYHKRYVAAFYMSRPIYDRANQRVIVAVVSDLHVGSTVGLCPLDGIALEDGGRYMPNEVQKWIWARWKDYWKEVKAWAGKSKVIVVVNGEFVEGNHHGTTQIAGPSPETMTSAAVEVFREPYNLAHQLYVVKGTAAHVRAGGADDEIVARELGAVRDTQTGKAARYHLILDVFDTRFDFNHHISGSARFWTKGNNIRAEVAGMLDMPSTERPNVVVRSHVHNFAETGRNFSNIVGVVTPAWQMLTEHGHKVVRRAQGTVGGLIFEVIKGQPMPYWEPVLTTLQQVQPHRAKV